MSETQNTESDRSMTKQKLLEHLQDIEWDNFEVKTARTDVPKDVWDICVLCGKKQTRLCGLLRHQNKGALRL